MFFLVMHKLGICIFSILLATLIFVNLSAVDVLSDNCNHSSENKICKEMSLSEDIKVNDYSRNISIEFSNIRREIEAAILQEIQLAMLESGSDKEVEEAEKDLKSE